MTLSVAWLLAAVSVAAALGSCLRFATDQALQRRIGGMELPIGTMTVNAAGSLLLGLATGLGLTGTVGSATVAVIGTGLCGGYTTFSTWTYETMRLLEEGDFVEAVLNVTLTLLLGLGLAGLGLLLATRL